MTQAICGFGDTFGHAITWFLGLTFDKVILGILGLAGVIGVLDGNGFLPKRFSKWLIRNKNEATLRALKELGVRAVWDEDTTKRSIFSRLLERFGIGQPEYKRKLSVMLEEDTHKGEFQIGKGKYFKGDTFIDVMGGSVAPERAAMYAKLLNSHFVGLGLGHFDAIACPKDGSPILAYEFAKLRKIPLILGCANAKVDSEDMDFHDKLDYPASVQLKNCRVLLADDSTTGGRKLNELAELLRMAGAQVEHAIILFEPEGKGARKLLESSKIQLDAIQIGPKGST